MRTDQLPRSTGPTKRTTRRPVALLAGSLLILALPSVAGGATPTRVPMALSATPGSSTAGSSTAGPPTPASPTPAPPTPASPTPAPPTPAPPSTQQPAPPQAISFAPAGGQIPQQSTITVQGSGTAEVTVVIDNVSFAQGTQTLPYAYAVPSLGQGTHPIAVTAVPSGGATSATAQATYSVFVPDTTAPQITYLFAPKGFSPHPDGYHDSFTVSINTDEPAIVKLFILHGPALVATGQAEVAATVNYPAQVSAGAGLPPGSYTWYVTVTDPSGNATTTVMHGLVADTAYLVNHYAALAIPAASIAYSDQSGSCSSARTAKHLLVLTSRRRCGSRDPYGDLSIAAVTAKLHPGYSFGTAKVVITSSVRGSANGVVFFLPRTSTVVAGQPLGSRRTVVNLPGADILSRSHDLEFNVSVAQGGHAVISGITVSYVYRTLVP